jgi:hypothetical protein
VVAALAAAGGRLQRRPGGRQRQGDGLEADQVLAARGGLQDEEVGLAGGDGAAQQPRAGADDALGAGAAGELLPQRARPHLGADRRHRLLLGLVAQPGREPRVARAKLSILR